MILRASTRVLATTLSLAFCIQCATPRSSSAEAESQQPAGASQSGFGHGEWPFIPPVRPNVPDIADSEWAANPIDGFVLARLADEGLVPNREADKATLLRRVTYDLTGLPPTSADLKEFLADHSKRAYERVVDRLLASPRFGERWAQHWLDVVRYAETEGFKTDELRKDAYRYRDYVIDSFNSDRPFDEFIRQQLAGDELEPNNPDALVATGFLRLYPDEDNAADLYQRRQEILDEVTDTTCLAFLGLTMGCAQCHDHKFDDIPQTDYYRLQAFFASMAQRDDVSLADSTATAKYQAGLAHWQEATAAVRREIDALLEPARASLKNFRLEKYEPDILASYLKSASQRTPLEEQIARMIDWRIAREVNDEATAMRLSPADKSRLAELKKALAEFDSLKPQLLPTAMSVADVGSAAPPTRLLDGGNWKRPETLLEPGFPKLLGTLAPQKVVLASVHRREPTTGRRTQLALWLTRPDHPLTARVIVNRLWQQHFGRGIVATPNDFGMQGDRATHPELLDWLAMELVENGWSLKHIHRLMATSATYQMTSLVDSSDHDASKATTLDRDNKLLWRANRRRLEGEAIRDAMLQTAGELNLQMHGPSARPELPEGVSQRYAWVPDKDAAQRNRRSVYVLAKRNMRYPLFEAFDQPDLHQSCARRTVTVTAPQSLAMLNSDLTLELAQNWAKRLLAEHAEPRELIRSAYQGAYSREATIAEITLAEAFFARQPKLIAKERDDAHGRNAESVADATSKRQNLGIDAVADFCHALFNSNEFITVD